MANTEVLLADLAAVGGWSTAALLARQRMHDRRTNNTDQPKRNK